MALAYLYIGFAQDTSPRANKFYLFAPRLIIIFVRFSGGAHIRSSVGGHACGFLFEYSIMDFLAQYNLTGLVIGVVTFLIIGLFHPLVIKGEYHFGVRCWWVFLVMGIAAVTASVAVRHILWSTLLAVWGASSFWSIGELFEQRRRVARGWFPKKEKQG